MFSSLVGIPIGNASSWFGLKNRAITAGTKMYKSIIKKKKKNDKIVLLAKSKLNSIEFLICKTLIDSSISHDELVLINNVLKEFYDMKEISKIPMTNKSLNYLAMLSYCLKCRKNIESKNPEVVKTKNRRIMVL